LSVHESFKDVMKEHHKRRHDLAYHSVPAVDAPRVVEAASANARNSLGAGALFRSSPVSVPAVVRVAAIDGDDDSNDGVYVPNEPQFVLEIDGEQLPRLSQLRDVTRSSADESDNDLYYDASSSDDEATSATEAHLASSLTYT
jgi:hypothetical protein